MALAQDAKPSIPQDVDAALQQMGKTLSAPHYSFNARTIRVYPGPDGLLLHIFHDTEVVVRRPNRLLVKTTGDDGVKVLAYDGKTVSVSDMTDKKYARISVPDTLEGMLHEIVGRRNIDLRSLISWLKTRLRHS